MKHLRPDTLAYFQKRPYLQRFKPLDTPLPYVVDGLKDYMAGLNGSMAHPESEAATFYLLNHACSQIQQSHGLHEVLSSDLLAILNAYIERGSNISRRLFYYILLASTREARHVGKSGLKTMGLDQKIINFIYSLPSGSIEAAEALKTNPPNVGVTEYMESLATIFTKGHFNSGYGGKPWANIASAGHRLVSGDLSPEMFTDVGWTLAHNNGCMFNKSMLYLMYTEHLATILDVQRAGMIPQLVADASRNHFGFPGQNHVTGLMKLVEPVLGDELTGYVDWQRVEDLGAKKNYSTYKKQQAKLHGEVGKKTVSGSVTTGKLFYLTPSQAVPVVNRKKAA